MTGTPSRAARGSAARRNLKEAGGKSRPEEYEAHKAVANGRDRYEIQYILSESGTALRDRGTPQRFGFLQILLKARATLHSNINLQSTICNPQSAIRNAT